MLLSGSTTDAQRNVPRMFAICWIIIVAITADAICPSTSNSCGDCPSAVSDKFSTTASVQIIGNRNMRCTIDGINALVQAGCLENSCFTVAEINVPFSYADCQYSQTQECIAWRWLHCAFPDDSTASGIIMHAYFFVGDKYEGMGFDFARKNVAGLLNSGGASTVDDGCRARYPQAADVVQAKFSAGKSKGLVLFGWDKCSCTSIAQARFRSSQLCSEQLTWSNEDSDVMRYLKCREGSTHHSFVYFADGDAWRFHGSGFDFDVNAMSNSELDSLASKSSVATGCLDELSVNIYGEPLSECRAASTDKSGSWMWDGKCTEEGGGVHQICMSQLPADFSVTTGQGPWSEGRANMRHCVCIGAWSLYMTREEDPTWTTTEAWPFCDAIPLSALTARYVGKWKDWNGIPAQISSGVTKLATKCLAHRSGPGSEPPTRTGTCHLAKALGELKAAESSLETVDVQTLTDAAGVDCSGVDVSQASENIASANSGVQASSPGGSGKSAMVDSTVGEETQNRPNNMDSDQTGAPSEAAENPISPAGSAAQSSERSTDKVASASSSKILSVPAFLIVSVMYSSWGSCFC